nr:Uncharacterised protein [Salmonella sp. NCTC 7297]
MTMIEKPDQYYRAVAHQPEWTANPGNTREDMTEVSFGGTVQFADFGQTIFSAVSPLFRPVELVVERINLTCLF